MAAVRMEDAWFHNLAVLAQTNPTHLAVLLAPYEDLWVVNPRAVFILRTIQRQLRQNTTADSKTTLTVLAKRNDAASVKMLKTVLSFGIDSSEVSSLMD